MDKDEIDAIKKSENMWPAHKVQELKENVQATIQLLQAILDKPDDMMIDISFDTDGDWPTAKWTQYQFEKSANGMGHHIVSNTYKSVKLSYDYAKFLNEFLTSVNLEHYSLELPKVESKELIIAAAQADVERAKRNIESSKRDLVWYEKRLKEIIDTE